MKAVVYHGIGDIRLEEVPEPRIDQPTDAIVRITASAICGTDLHFIRGTFPGMQPGTILGHEGVGVVEEVGRGLRNFRKGDRVVIASTIACGFCSYCRDGYFAQCDTANPHGKLGGTAFFGSPSAAGGFHGLQAEFARIPFAQVGMVKVPEEVSDDQAILISDIFPTGYFGAELAEIREGDTVAVFGCGPVGQFALAAAHLMGAERVFAVDCLPDRLDMARDQGAEVIHFNEEDPVAVLRELTGGIGPDRVIDAVGVDAEPASQGPAAEKGGADFEKEVEQITAGLRAPGAEWQPGRAPSQAVRWAVESVCKAGTVAIIGVYPLHAETFPLGMAANKNLTLQMGNCHHRRYMPMLLDLVRSGRFDPESVITRHEPFLHAVDAYRAFDQRQPGWIKVELETETEDQPGRKPTRYQGRAASGRGRTR